MALPVPLGVRIYSTPLSLDVWVTKNVEGLQFRSAVPGGFMDATFRFRRYTPIEQPDAIAWNPVTSAISTDNQSFKVTDANAASIAVGDRFWVYDSSGNIRMRGDRFTVTDKASSGGTTTVSYAPNSRSDIVASGDSVICKKPAAFYDSQLTGFNRLINLFNKVQIVDLRTAEIVWEGRIENPARETDKDTWTLGCLGNTVYATDINLPVYYLSNSVEDWLTSGAEVFAYDVSGDSGNQWLSIGFKQDVNWAGGPAPFSQWLDAEFMFQGTEKTAMESVGRFDAIVNGNDDSNVTGRLGVTLQAMNWNDTFPTSPVDQENIAQYILSTGASNFASTKLVGTHIAYGAKKLFMAVGYFSTSATLTTPANATMAKWTLPRVQALRQDRFGNLLATGASYPDPALKVAPVIEDVVGRFLVTGWNKDSFNVPYAGFIDPNNVYIDTSNNVLMSDGWTFWDGTDAKGIFEKIIAETQPNAFWGIWESSFDATEQTAKALCRFAWETWPASWGYQVTSVDGLTEQPNGENEYNYVSYIYGNGVNEDWRNLWASGSRHVQTFWRPSLGISPGSDLDYNNVTRAQTVVRGSNTDVYPGSMFTEAGAWCDDNSRPINSGQIKIGRPVLVYDKGLTGPFGMARNLDPWMIRPGKVMRIMDLLPATSMSDFAYGANLPNKGFDNCIFRMVETEYDSDSNMCTVSLDSPPTWYVPQQIVTRTKPGAPFITAYR